MIMKPAWYTAAAPSRGVGPTPFSCGWCHVQVSRLSTWTSPSRRLVELLCREAGSAKMGGAPRSDGDKAWIQGLVLLVTVYTSDWLAEVTRGVMSDLLATHIGQVPCTAPLLP